MFNVLKKISFIGLLLVAPYNLVDAARNNSSDEIRQIKHLQERVEILEQKIKLLQKEQEFTNTKIEETKKIKSYTEIDEIKFNNGNALESEQLIGTASDLTTNKTQINLKELYNGAIQYIRAKNYDKAQELLQIIISEKNPQEKDKEIIANSYYLTGEISAKNKDYETASNYFLQSYNSFVSFGPENLQAANSLFKLSNSLSLMDKKDAACNSLKKLEKDFHKLPESLKEQILIANTKLHCE